MTTFNEFDLIKNYFSSQDCHRNDVNKGIGDDAAIITVPIDHDITITTDTLVSGVHFYPSVSAFDIGFKALAVNLSDLAAMGATPAWITLALTLPTVDTAWLEGFSEGLFTLANRYQVQLIGGDITHGPLSITIQALGLLPKGQALLRSNAKIGDHIYVTGTLGDAGLALVHTQQKVHLNPNLRGAPLTKLHQPEPRLATGRALLGIANAAIDISDGLAADLNHILIASHVGAIVNVDQLPLSPELQQSIPHESAIELALTAGDDYELCFTVSPPHIPRLEKALSSIACRYTCIGEITAQPGLHLYNKQGPYHGKTSGYQHF